MACVVVGRIWDEEVGGRPPSILEEVEIKKKLKESPPVQHTTESPVPSKKRKRSPFRPWTPESRPPGSTYSDDSHPHRRNYKNMTRERRIEANARERTRVHTISAAYENLRRAVPAYSHNQKLSKLAVLRVASSYILTLSRIIGQDYSQDQSEPTLQSCVESITATIQMEGRLKKKRDDQ